MTRAVAALLLLLSAFPYTLANLDHFQIGNHIFALRDDGDQSPMVEEPDFIPIFNPQYMMKEVQRVSVKYARATEILQGIGLTPLLDIPLVDEFPQFEDPSAIGGVQSNASAQSDSLEAIHDVNDPFAEPPVSKLPLTDFIQNGIDILYYGPINIGTPEQALTVDFDTGSADLWVASECPSCFVPEFAPDASQTYKDLHEPFAIQYGTGDVYGELGCDVVDIAGLKVTNQTFGLARSESQDFESSPFSGIMGFGFGSIAASGEPTVFENLMIGGQVLVPFFSVHLARGKKSGSEVCLGCYDVTKAVGGVSWAPVVSKTYWTVSMQGVSVNETSASTDISAAIDTGTTLIYVPDNVAQAFYALIPGAQQSEQYGPRMYTYPCSTTLEVSFNFGGQNFAMSARDFNLGHTAQDSTDCVGGIISLGDAFPEDLAIIGDIFLKNWYTVYDYSNGARVGFASSVNNL